MIFTSTTTCNLINNPLIYIGYNYDEENNVVGYKYIKINSEDFAPAASIDISLDSSNYVMDVPVVKCETQEIYDVFKQKLQESEMPFFRLTEPLLDLKFDDKQLALVLRHKHYNIYYNDISANSADIITPNSTIFTCDDEIQDTLYSTLEGQKLSREGYNFVGYAFYVKTENGTIDYENLNEKNIACKFDGNVGVEVYEYLSDSSACRFFLFNKENVAKFLKSKYPPFNIYLYAVWKPKTYNIVYQYDTNYGGRGDVSYYSINGVKIDNSNLAKLSVTQNYGTTYTIVSLDELTAFDFVCYNSVEVAYNDSNNPTKVKDGSNTYTVSYDKDLCKYVYTKGEKIFIVESATSSYTILNLESYLATITDEEEKNKITSGDIRTITYESDTYQFRYRYIPDGFEFDHIEINRNSCFELSNKFPLDFSNQFAICTTEPYTITFVLYMKRANVVVSFENLGDKVSSFYLSRYVGTSVTLPTGTVSTIDDVQREIGRASCRERV